MASTIVLSALAVFGLITMTMALRSRRRSNPETLALGLKKDLSALINEVRNEKKSFERLLEEAESNSESLKTSLHEIKKIEAAIDGYKKELEKIEKTLSEAVTEARKGMESFVAAASEARAQIDTYCKAILAEKSKFLLRSPQPSSSVSQTAETISLESQKFDIQVERVFRRQNKQEPQRDMTRSDPRLGVLGARA